MRILVTGGCGFLGSHLVDRLVARGDEVHVIDDLWTGTKQFNNPQAHYTYGDVSDPDGYTRHHYGELYDRIYHLASPASPPKYMADPIGTMRANFVGALKLIEALDRHGGCPKVRFCFASTSEVYGDPLVSPLPETYNGSVNCTGPRSSYDESKRATEALLHEVHRTEKMPIRCARIFNAYGPRTQPDDGRAVSNFITQGLQGKPLTVFGDGSQTRCFTYVDCIVEGLLRYFDLDDAADAPAPTVMNIGCDRETTVLEIAQHVSAKLNVDIVFRDLPFDDPRQRKPDLTRARQWLPDWDPHAVPYEEGIARTIAHFKERIR